MKRQDHLVTGTLAEQAVFIHFCDKERLMEAKNPRAFGRCQLHCLIGSGKVGRRQRLCLCAAPSCRS